VTFIPAHPSFSAKPKRHYTLMSMIIKVLDMLDDDHHH
jgi:hypothetical protein